MSGSISQVNSVDTPSVETVRAQLDRIAGSTDFDTSRRSRDFLRFIVEETLAGRENQISQHAIATRVFGRGDDFDPTTDPIVRMQAGRVRRCLEHYYLVAGTADPVRIDLPKGAYVPAFAPHQPPSETSPPASQAPQPGDPDSWPTLLVSPLRNLSGQPELDYVATGLASDLAAELDRNADMQIFLSAPTPAADSPPCPARFELTGSVIPRGDGVRVNLHLVDTTTNRQMWAQAYHCEEGVDLGKALDEVVQTTAAVVAEENGVLHAQLGGEMRQDSRPEAGAYEAILRYRHFDVEHTPETFVKALETLHRAVKESPDCALCWSYLARLGATHWGTGMPGEVFPIEESLSAARRGVELCPTDLRCRLLLGYVHLVNDQIDQARIEAEMALQLSRGSTFWLDAIGYILTLTGDWERGTELVRKAVRINPYHRKSCYGALWLDALRRNDARVAAATAREYTPIANFWHPLMRAVAASMCEDRHEARLQAKRLLELRPDFPERGRWLITRYVKFDALVDTIVEGLADCGLQVT